MGVPTPPAGYRLSARQEIVPKVTAERIRSHEFSQLPARPIHHALPRRYSPGLFYCCPIKLFYAEHTKSKIGCAGIAAQPMECVSGFIAYFFTMRVVRVTPSVVVMVRIYTPCASDSPGNTVARPGAQSALTLNIVRPAAS